MIRENISKVINSSCGHIKTAGELFDDYDLELDTEVNDKST
jgi:hypothetical protein